MSDSALVYEASRLVGRAGPRPAGLASEARRWYWRFIRRYAYEICDRCGRPVGRCTGSWWGADDALWRDINGAFAGVMCPPCFTRACADRGVYVRWAAVVDRS